MYMYLYIYIYTHYYHHKMCAGYLKPPKAATSERSTQGVDRLTSLNGRAQDALETPRTEKKGRAGISKWVIPPKKLENRRESWEISFSIMICCFGRWSIVGLENAPKSGKMSSQKKNIWSPILRTTWISQKMQTFLWLMYFYVYILKVDKNGTTGSNWRSLEADGLSTANCLSKFSPATRGRKSVRLWRRQLGKSAWKEAVWQQITYGHNEGSKR